MPEGPNSYYTVPSVGKKRERGAGRCKPAPLCVDATGDVLGLGLELVAGVDGLH